LRMNLVTAAERKTPRCSVAGEKHDAPSVERQRDERRKGVVGVAEREEQKRL